ELGAAQSGHEIAPADPSGFLHGPKHAIDAGEAPGYALTPDGISGEHAVALEEQAGHRHARLGGAGLDQFALHQTPAALTPGRSERAQRTEAGPPRPRRPGLG